MTRKVWAFALKSKDQVLNMFKFFYAYVERRIRRKFKYKDKKKIKYVRADNGSEYRGPSK